MVPGWLAGRTDDQVKIEVFLFTRRSKGGNGSEKGQDD